MLCRFYIPLRGAKYSCFGNKKTLPVLQKKKSRKKRYSVEKLAIQEDRTEVYKNVVLPHVTVRNNSIQLSLHTLWRDTRTAPLVLSFDTRWRWVVSIIHRLLYPRGKSPSNRYTGEACWNPQPVCTFLKTKIFFRYRNQAFSVTHNP